MRTLNPYTKPAIIFEQIKKYGPVTSIAVANALGITTQSVQSAVGLLRTKFKINIQKKGDQRRKETLNYFYDKEFPIIGAPSLTEQKKTKEEDDLFDDLNIEEEQIAPMEEKENPTFLWPKTTEKSRNFNGLNSLVDRCHHLVLALEHCSSDSIQDAFNLNDEQARILMNKVVSKFKDVSVSFCINEKKEK